jgi:hypothetical protein
VSFAVKLAKASIPDDLRNDIKYGNYPHVARTADPLLVRPDALALMVADTVYHARVKLGLGCKGYYIYASGLGLAVYENVYTNDREFNIEFGTKDNTPDSDAIKAIKDKAKEWLDELEVAIASHPSDNSIKKAIDRLCWQMHYDITESHLNFPEAFSDNDFADVKIDRYPLDSTYFDGYTLKTTISDIAGVEHSSELLPSGQVVVNVTNEGYFSETSDRIQAFDDHMTKNAYDTDSDGAMKKLQTIIEDFDDHLNKGAWDSSNGSLNKIATKLVPDGNDYYSISECLRDGQNISGATTFSIARSLRESGGNSVPVQEHIRLETQEIKDGLGANGSINTTLSSIKTNSDTVITRIGDFGGDTILGRLLNIDNDLDTVKTNTGTAATNTGTIASNTGTIADKIGDENTSGTVMRRLFLINGDTTEIKNSM